jgi:hypothetical protein
MAEGQRGSNITDVREDDSPFAAGSSSPEVPSATAETDNPSQAIKSSKDAVISLFSTFPEKTAYL